MFLPCFYTRYVRFGLDFLLVFFTVSFLSGSILAGFLISAAISLLNYAFRFYSVTSLRYLLLKDRFLIFFKSLLVNSLVYGIYILIDQKEYMQEWMYLSITISLILPYATQEISDYLFLKAGPAKRIYLNGLYPQLNTVFSDIESAARGRLVISQNGKEHLERSEKKHDGRTVIILCEAALGKIPVEVASCFEEFFSVNVHFFYVPVKRLVDILIALLFIVILWVPMLIVAMVIYAEDRENVIFTQTRIGRKGKAFTLYKFRSMRNSEYNPEEPNSNIEKRLLAIGNLIRKTRLDETLQFFNVLKGDMSVIGPRPEMEFYHEKCVDEIPCYLYRLDVRPGITGWAQTCFIHTSSLDQYREKTAYDLFYVKRYNPLMDIQILVKTIGTIFMLIGSR